MTEFEEKAIVTLASALKDYDDANPDVGMGPFPASFIEDAAKQLGFEVTLMQAFELGKRL